VVAVTKAPVEFWVVPVLVELSHDFVFV